MLVMLGHKQEGAIVGVLVQVQHAVVVIGSNVLWLQYDLDVCEPAPDAARCMEWSLSLLWFPCTVIL